jgi:hypothetical protein
MVSLPCLGKEGGHYSQVTINVKRWGDFQWYPFSAWDERVNTINRDPSMIGDGVIFNGIPSLPGMREWILSTSILQY